MDNQTRYQTYQPYIENLITNAKKQLSNPLDLNDLRQTLYLTLFEHQHVGDMTYNLRTTAQNYLNQISQYQNHMLLDDQKNLKYQPIVDPNTTEKQLIKKTLNRLFRKYTVEMEKYHTVCNWYHQDLFKKYYGISKYDPHSLKSLNKTFKPNTTINNIPKIIELFQYRFKCEDQRQDYLFKDLLIELQQLNQTPSQKGCYLCI